MSTVAVVVLAYDRPQFLVEALLSVARQTRLPDEILVVDDHSPQPLEIPERVSKSLPIRLIRQANNQGPAQAACRALAEVRSDLVSFLNDDDLWEPRFLERLGEALDSHQDAVAAFCDHWVVGVDGALDRTSSDRATVRFKRDRLPSGLVRNMPRVALVDRSMPGASFSMTRRTELDPGIIATAGNHWDYFVCLCACRSGRPGVYVDERLGSYRVSPNGITANLNDPHRRVVAIARRIVAARLILHSTPLRSIWREQRIGIVMMAARGCVIAIRTNSLRGSRSGITEIVNALREPLPQ